MKRQFKNNNSFSTKMEQTTTSASNTIQNFRFLPSMEELIKSCGLNFTTELDSGTQAWAKHITNTWNTWKKSPTLENTISKFYKSSPNPFNSCLVIIIQCKDFKDAKPKTLPYTFVEVLKSWASSNGYNMLVEDLKVIAYIIATQQRNQSFFYLICQTYQVSTVSSKVIPIVKMLLQNGNYKQAFLSVLALNIVNEIPPVDILMPLLIQDKTGMIEEYLQTFPMTVEGFILHIDSLLEKAFPLRNYFENYIHDNNIDEVKWEKLYFKPLGKLISRLCNKFNIQLTICKNLSRSRASGMLKYLVQQKYVEKKVGLSAWEDMINDTLRVNPDLVNHFIELLSEYDTNDAVKWVSVLNLSLDNFPELAHLQSNGSTDHHNDCDEDENWELDGSRELSYKLSVPLDNVVIVDSIEKFYEMVTVNLNNVSIIGVDSEWKPSYGTSKPNVALIQVATYDNIYLIDTLELNKPEVASFWKLFAKNILENANIVKLGFSLENDLRELKNSINEFHNLKLTGFSFLDLSTVWKYINDINIKLPHGNSVGGSGLSCLVESCFGCPLKKQEQFSNWEMRPLRSAQIEYAAIDAHVLLEIHTFLADFCKRHGINFDELCNNIMMEGKTKIPKKLEKRRNHKIKERVKKSSKKASHDIHFLIESKLTDLLMCLRACGINSTVIPPKSLWHDIVKKAKDENSIIVLEKNNKVKPSIGLPLDNIYETDNCDLEKELIDLLTFYNVQITPENLCKYCPLCNDNYMKSIDLTVFKETYRKYNEFQSVKDPNNIKKGGLMPAGFYSDEEDEDDEFHNQAPSRSERLPDCCTTYSGKLIQFDNISLELLEQNCLIILCHGCGKLYFNNIFLPEHLQNIVNRIMFKFS